MEAMKLMVFCAFFSESLCDETNVHSAESTSFLHTLVKRGSEIDPRLQDRISRTPPSAVKRPINIRPLIADKPLKSSRPCKNIINPNNISSRRLYPKLVRHNPKAPVNPTNEKPLTYISNRHDDKKITNDIELSKSVKPIDRTEIDSPTLDDEKTNKEDEITKGRPGSVAPEIRNELAKLVAEEREQNTINEKENAPINSTEDLLANNTSPIEKPLEKPRNEPHILPKEGRDNSKHSMKHEALIQNDVTNNSKTGQPDAKISPGINLLPVFIGAPKLLVPKINQGPALPNVTIPSNLTTLLRTSKELEEKEIQIPRTGKTDSICTTLQKIAQNANKIETKENQETPLLKPKKIDPSEELVIQNNNYEEFYESSTPFQYLQSKPITSEMFPEENFNNFDPIPSDPNDTYGDTGNYNNKPYLYDTKKYPNQYVIDINDEDMQGNYCNPSYATNANRWYKNCNSYCRPQALKAERANFNNYQRQGYFHNRIWRSWKNNRIVIRPRSAGAKNKEFYRITNEHKTNQGNMPIYTAGKVIGSGGYGNQNMASNNSSIQFNNRYGY